MARIFSLIARVHRVLHRVSCSYETIPNAPKYYKGPMGWIGCVRCKKSRRHFVARTLALIAPIHPILHRVSCSYEMIPNAPKHYETHQNMSLGSNRVDQVRLLEKLQARTIALIAPVLYVLQQVSCSYEMIPNASKYYETDRNISLGSNGVDWLHSLRKIPSWLRGTNFCMNWTSSVCFATSFMQLQNDPKCTQILRNIPKHYFRVNGVGGLGLSIAKNPDVTSWHELLH